MNKMQNTGYPFITPSSTCLSEDLLFFDTFSHSGNERDNFDLVQFPSPVVIDLIKIVPLGQPIEAKIPGNVRLGATNPSKCELEFYINDLTKQDAHTMTDLGQFHCSESETDFNPPLQIQTDGLLLKGNYRTLTLAIFGQIASYDEKPDDEQQIIQSAASPPAQTPASPVASECDMPYLVRAVDQEYMRRARDDSGSIDESIIRSNDAMKEEILFDGSEMIDNQIMDLEDSEAPSKDQILDEMSSSEGGPSIGLTPRDKKSEGIDYSNSADLDVQMKRQYKEEPRKHTSESMDIVKSNEDRESDEFADQDAKEWFFDVESYQPKPLVYFYDPSLTIQERAYIAHKSLNGLGVDRRAMDKIVEVKALNCNEDQRTDEWVTLIEDLARSGPSLGVAANERETLEFLIDQVSQGLDYDLALRQIQTRFKVRHLRAGLKLTMALFHCGVNVVKRLLDASIPQKILALYSKDRMSLPIRLLIVRCLSIVSDSAEGAQHLIEHPYIWQDASERLKKIRTKTLTNEQNETKASELDDTKPKFEPLSGDIKQCKMEPEIALTEDHIQSIRSPDKKTQNLEDDQDANLQEFTCYQYLLLILLSHQPSTRIVVAIGSLIRKLRLYNNLEKLFLICSSELEESEDSTLDTGKPVSPKLQTHEIVEILQHIVDMLNDKAASITQPERQLPARTQFQIISNTTASYLAIYRWMKQFQTIETLNTLLESPISETSESPSRTGTEQTICLQNLCLKLLDFILNSPKGCQFFLAADSCDCAGRLIRTLGSSKCSRRSSHLRVSDGIENLALLCREESLSVISRHDMSLKLSYSFKVLSGIDRLFNFHHEKRESSLHDPEKILHQLYIMSDHPYGLSAIIKHFSSYGNLDCLLNFFRMPEHHKNLEFVRETSIDYVLELMGTFFRLNNNVLGVAMEYFKALEDISKNKDKSYSVRVKSLLPWLNPFDTEEQILMINYSEETFRQLTRVIRKSIPNYSIPFAKGLDFELPPKMITAVRILRQLCIPPQVETFIETNFDPLSLQRQPGTNSKLASFMAFVESQPHQQNNNLSWNLNIQTSRNNGLPNASDDSIADHLGSISNTFILFQPYDHSICGELKYHYGITQLYEQEGLKRLLNTLRELVGNYPRPIFQSAALSGLRGRIVISYINSVVMLLHSIICHLIDARGSEFKDTSVIPVILETYSLLCFVPEPSNKRPVNVCEVDLTDRNKTPTGDGDLTDLHRAKTIRLENYQLAQQTKSMILSILMSYTQMCLSVSESEEKVISKSMWTRMLKEVVDFSLSTPVFFAHGLDVLTKILPSPLPCGSMMDSIDQEQLFKNINHRKLWSAHLHPLHQQIEHMISNLSLCHQSNIRSQLYYLCNQLCDLSSNAACMVAKIITDILVAYVTKLSPETGNHSSQTDQQQASQQSQPPGSAESEVGRSNVSLLKESAESSYAIKMILNLLTNLITNQAFETAFTSHLQLVGKRDEKFFVNSRTIVGQYVECRVNDSADEGPVPGSANSVAQLVESIKSINRNSAKDGQSMILVTPPEELTKIDLLEVARKTPDRFSISSGIKKTYRLRVLLDLNSCARRSGEPLPPARSSTSSSTVASKRLEHAKYGPSYPEVPVAPSHKPYMPPSRPRGRSSARPDSFRSRPQNTSRPPSIHVDDFIDLYGDNPSQQAAGRFMNPAGSSASKAAVDNRARRDDFRNWRPLR